ncbi:SIR2-domain-containing protein [Mycena maculata]|uniref:SIR2-domain-containing protein n=1 Tax=Mycena maculata TaxID=230809 RepID=A0AAD7JIA2_9AGAR|nr:SIR2-domain-containing protein [Mycena maculata]
MSNPDSCDAPGSSSPSLISQTQTPSSSNSDLLDLRVNQHLSSSQIRAFLAASEDVDIDPETVEELVHALIVETTTASSRADNVNSGIHVSEDAVESETFDVEISDLDISALYFFPEEEVQTWSQQQIRGMMHHLKEHGMSSWMNEYFLKRNIPIPQLLLAFGINLSPNLHNMSPTTLAYFLRVAMSRELRLRDKLPNHNTVEDAVRLIRDSRRILILTGAGISVSCGIPDFRSRDGLYASLKQRGDYDLDDPQQMFDINYFRENPAVFYSFASQIYPSNFVPSPCHRFIRLVENKNQLLRTYTQNIDNLCRLAGVQRVVQCHGSFATASCILCRRQVPGSEIEADILAQKVPLCSVCNAPQTGTAASKSKSKKKNAKKAKGGWDSDEEDESDGPTYPPGVMKPNITFFGEKLADEFDHSFAADRKEVDLLLVIGTSLKVSPVADILCHLPHSVPQILINKTPVRHINPDIVLLGNADDIIIHLCAKLGWDLPSTNVAPRASISDSPPFLQEKIKKRPAADLHASEEPRRAGESHIWLFEGAEGGEWLENIEQQISSHGTSKGQSKK